ncbi:MAG: cation transporter [Planctomycetes bacterium]|nr:cation transporter [Planctomycetota bacterium]
MGNPKIKAAEKQIKSVTNLALLVNVALFAAKMTAGILIGSMALVADGIHSLSDMSTDFAVLLGLRISAKEPDQNHPYGHGRAETFSAGFIAIVLISVGIALVYYATIGIAKDNTAKPHAAMLIVAAASIIIKEILYRITKKVAISTHSTALYANAWHHKSDALSSIAVVIGYISLKLGFGHGDQLAAIMVGLMIIIVAVKILGDCLRELGESAVDKKTIENIKNIINENSAVRQWHKLRSRTVGREVFLDLHILVDPNLNITEAHEIAEQLENALHWKMARPVNIIIHIEPDIPQLRK